MLSPKQNIINTLIGKKVLFLENDNSLDESLDLFQQLLLEAEITNTVLFDLEEIDIEVIRKLILEHDAVVYMTQWVYEISKTLKSYLTQLSQGKIIIEAYINEPTWYYQLPGIAHQMYIFNGYNPDKLKFYRLSEAPYWNYKNKFDK